MSYCSIRDVKDGVVVDQYGVRPRLGLEFLVGRRGRGLSSLQTATAYVAVEREKAVRHSGSTDLSFRSLMGTAESNTPVERMRTCVVRCALVAMVSTTTMMITKLYTIFQAIILHCRCLNSQQQLRYKSPRFLWMPDCHPIS